MTNANELIDAFVSTSIDGHSDIENIAIENGFSLMHFVQMDSNGKNVVCEYDAYASKDAVRVSDYEGMYLVMRSSESHDGYELGNFSERYYPSMRMMLIDPDRESGNGVVRYRRGVNRVRHFVADLMQKYIDADGNAIMDYSDALLTVYDENESNSSYISNRTTLVVRVARMLDALCCEEDDGIFMTPVEED